MANLILDHRCSNVEYFGDLAAVILRSLRLLKMASAQFSLHYTAEEVFNMLDVSD